MYSFLGILLLALRNVHEAAIKRINLMFMFDVIKVVRFGFGLKNFIVQLPADDEVSFVFKLCAKISQK